MSKPVEADWSQIAQHFKNAKRLLLDLSTELAEVDGDWDRARMCFDLARDVDKLHKRIGSLGEVNAIREQSESPHRHPAAADLRESAEEYPLIPSKQSAQTLAEPRPRLRKRKRGSVFYIQNNSLIKRGLKRNGKETYEHKMSREEFDQFVGMLSTLAERQDVFKPEDVGEGLAMSSYKLYLGLGAMTHIGVLEIPQRGTYEFCKQSSYFEDSSEIWKELDSQKEEMPNGL